MDKLVLSNFQAPGDTVMLTAAVRDLHRCYPGLFQTDVRTSYPELWENNPYISEIAYNDPEAREIDCEYPLVRQSNSAPYHFIHGFVRDLNEKLRLSVQLTEFKGDIHLSPEDREWPGCLQGLLPKDEKFWVIVSGGKYDFTTKWWDPMRFQDVVDHFHDRIQFVQVGAKEDFHPSLANVVDLRGRTNLRELIQVIHHAEGVLTPVSLAMHLAAAIETNNSHVKRRPCVVVAGGREPPSWEAYPQHQYIHTSGALTCCAEGGCWKARAYPLGDGNEKDEPQHLCTNLAGSLPRCMDLISSDEVIRRISTYYEGGVLAYRHINRQSSQVLTPRETRKLITTDSNLTPQNAEAEAIRFLGEVPPPPDELSGRGIVICGGGPRYFPCAWICIQMLRELGCTLPIELWYLGPMEMDAHMKSLVQPLGVVCRDGRSHLKDGEGKPGRTLGGFELKPYAILHSQFREVLLIDADNVPVGNPEYLFDLPEYIEEGAIFWPDYGRLSRSREIWNVCGVSYRDEPEFESGQIVVDKLRCWEALQLTLWYNEHSDFFYKYIHGDKDTFHMAFRKVGKPYAMPAVPIHPLDYTMCQHDFQGERIFQHRNLAKWMLRQPNLRIHDFWHEEKCLDYLKELEQKWDGRIDATLETACYEGTRLAGLARKITSRSYRYHRVGFDSRLLSFRRNGTIGQGAADNEIYWDLYLHEGKPLLEIASLTRPTCLLTEEASVWKGQCLVYEQMPIELIPA
jgi:ADP-heptose:LPS heptosyltransferase